jgi:uncharacterized membrane protein
MPDTNTPLNQDRFYMATPNYPSFFSFLSMISPFILIIVLVFISIINSNIKGLIYLLGVILLFFIIMPFQQTVRHYGKFSHTPDPTCQLFYFPVPIFSVPSFNSSLFLFTFIYLLLPMIENNIMNFPLMVILLVLYAMDTVIKTKNNCTTPQGIVLGSLLGVVWGITWYFIIKSSNSNLLYYDDLLSNKIGCSRPTQQKFRCSVYKNGQLLQSI